MVLISNANYMSRENSRLKRSYYELEKYIRDLKSKEKKYIDTISPMKTQVKTLVENLNSKEEVVILYQDASRVIADQKRTITEQGEKIKFMTNLQEIKMEKTELRQRKTDATVNLSITAPAPASTGPAPPQTTKEGEVPRQGKKVSFQMVTAASSALLDPASVVPASADPTKAAPPPACPTPAVPQPGFPAPTVPDSADPAANSVFPGAPAEEEGWRDASEEVWEDDETGDLVLH